MVQLGKLQSPSSCNFLSLWLPGSRLKQFPNTI